MTNVDEALTIVEIQSRFQSEWVLIKDPQTNESLEVQSGKVLYHSKDRDDVYRKAVELHPKNFAMLYTGTIPRDTAIVLCASLSIRTRDSWLATQPSDDPSAGASRLTATIPKPLSSVI